MEKEQFKNLLKTSQVVVSINPFDYAKENSLILTAREYVGGKRLETIEIDLKTFKIIQSRGVNNGYTKKHKTIVKLMNDHMDEVRRLSRSRKRKKASERVTAVA